MLNKIETLDAPRAIGPYSQAVSANGFIFVSGQLPIDPETGTLVEGDIGKMTTRVVDNMEAILKKSGSSLDKVVNVQVFLKDLKRDFMPMNEIYIQRFKSPCPPARATVEVSELPLGSLIEMACVAII